MTDQATWRNDSVDQAARRSFLHGQRFDGDRWVDEACGLISSKVRTDSNYFLAPDLQQLLAEVFQIPYPDLLAKGLIPSKQITDGMGEVRYRAQDLTGQAKWIGSEAGDLPLADVTRSEQSIIVDTIGMQFTYTIDELAAAAAGNQPLDTDRAAACRLLIERGIDEALCVGIPNRGVYGLLNQDLASDAAELITLTTGTWAGASAVNIHKDIAQMINKIRTDTKGTSTPTHMGFPTAIWNQLRTMVWGSDNNSLTVLTVLRQNFEGMTFFEWPRLDTADAAGTGGRVICFAQNQLNWFYAEARPFTPEAPQVRGLRFEVPCHARLTPGVAVRNALTIKYADNAM